MRSMLVMKLPLSLRLAMIPELSLKLVMILERSWTVVEFQTNLRSLECMVCRLDMEEV